MVLFSFSIPEHIDLIKSAKKSQTTRIPRKSRKNGAPAYKVGDKVQLYYKSRMKASCANCIKIECDRRKYILPNDLKIKWCKAHSNIFGESEIIEIRHYDVGPYYENGFEFWMSNYLGNLPEDEKKSWAVADGFSGGWKEANHWFAHNTQNNLWAFEPLDVIVWDKENIIERWKK